MLEFIRFCSYSFGKLQDCKTHEISILHIYPDYREHPSIDAVSTLLGFY